MKKTFVITGPIIHSESFGELTVLADGFVTVHHGKIVACGSAKELPEVRKNLKIGESEMIVLSKGQFLMPGLIDTHIHAPQYPNAGLGYDKSLLDWLDTYTFPLEAKYTDLQIAQKVYSTIVKRTLKNGTTTACYFATIHTKSSLILADETGKAGQRALIGKVNMNQNHPEYYGENSDQSILDTNLFVTSILQKKNPLIMPVITPRFAISCDMPLMQSLADIAKTHKIHIQTHISESLGEIEFVKQLYPDCKNYADVYDKANLLTNKTVLAHGVHLDDDELAILSSRGTSISHCPNSNTSIQSGACDVRRLLSAGIKVGLGTDISGGYSPSILDAMRFAITVSTHISFNERNKQPLNYKDVFHLATLGGAQALALDERIGNFVIGKEFDALIIDMNTGSPIYILEEYSLLEQLQKFIFLGDDRNILKVFVAGELVKKE